MNIIPIALLGAGAMLLMGKKKRKKKTPLVEQLNAELPPMVAPPKKKKAGSTTIKKRQQSLVDTGYDVGPSGVDGKMGPDTRAAIRGFQSDAGIDVDGLWGPQTAAAMAKALQMALEGLGRAAYGQIGKMLDKFKSTFEKFFEPGEGGQKLEKLEKVETGSICPSKKWIQSRIPSNVFKYQFECRPAPYGSPSGRIMHGSITAGRWVKLYIRVSSKEKWPELYRKAIESTFRIAKKFPGVRFVVLVTAEDKISYNPYIPKDEDPDSWISLTVDAAQYSGSGPIHRDRLVFFEKPDPPRTIQVAEAAAIQIIAMRLAWFEQGVNP